MHVRLETIFNAALNQGSHRERLAFLEGACGGDSDLRRQVEQLLADYEDGEFLEGHLPGERDQVRSTSDSHSLLGGPSTLANDSLSRKQIGPYRLRELLGEGGMGSVYVAEQDKPVRRNVALKVIKPGMGSREVISRFESERQALALMDHPNIARILDAGATEQGLPFFVMELVRGLPITQYCDQSKKGIRDRMALFIDVCHAIHHAHQKGIIHRDIKPSNVLVTLHDGKPIVKIIDFGVAKALHQPLSQHSIYTALNQVIGTPLYMSPEQLELSGLDIDTRTDIYSLGVLLYELLTGRTPFDHEQLMKSGFDEMRRIIREDEPPRPSQRVTTLPKAELSTAATRRGLDERSFSKSVQSELDWITLKAMEKDRNRRFESASAMAADVQRYLNDETVLACPPSTRYRFSKFARRNWVALTTTSIVALTLIVGTGLSSWQAIRAVSAERRADAGFAEARLAVDEMYTGVAEEWLKQQPNLTEVQHGFLQKALAFYDRLAATQVTTPELRYERARAFQRVGAIQAKFGKYDPATTAYRSCIAESKDLVQLFPDRQDCRFVLASCRTQLAESLRNSGNEGLAKEQALLAHADLRRLDHNHNMLPKDQVELAHTLGVACHLLTQAKCLTEAKELADRELLICQSLVNASPSDYRYRSALASGYATLGSHYLWWGQQNDEAEAALRKALGQLGILEQQRPNDVQNRNNLAGVLWNLGMVLARKHKEHPDLEALYRRSLEIFSGLVRDFPDFIEYRDGLATMHSKLAGIDHVHGRHADSEAHYRAALEIYEYCANTSTDGPRFEIRVGNMLDGLGGQLIKQLKIEEATAVYRRWAEYSRAMYGKHQDSNTERTRPQVIRSSLALASILLHQKNHVEASRAIDDLPQYFADAELRESANEVVAMFGPRAVLLNCATLAQGEGDQEQEPTNHAAQNYLSRTDSWLEKAELLATRWAATIEVHPDVIGWTVVDLCELLLSQAEQANDPLFSDQPDGTREAHQLLVSSVIQHAVKGFPDDPSLHLIADFLSTAPDGFRNNELALQLTERCLKLNPEDELSIQSRVWALFRNQEWSQCIEVAASLKDRSASDFVLAMAHWQLGHGSEAGELLRRGQSWLVGYELRSKERLQQGKLTHPSPIMLRRLEDEAIRLIDVSTNP